MTPFPMIELAVKELIESRYPAVQGNTGGDLSYMRGSGLYVWFALVTGSTDRLEGDWIVDIDIFADTYTEAMQASLALEAALIGVPYARTSVMILDSITQNEAPSERPWDDETVFRVGAAYAFAARRSG